MHIRAKASNRDHLIVADHRPTHSAALKRTKTKTTHAWKRQARQHGQEIPSERPKTNCRHEHLNYSLSPSFQVLYVETHTVSTNNRGGCPRFTTQAISWRGSFKVPNVHRKRPWSLIGFENGLENTIFKIWNFDKNSLMWGLGISLTNADSQESRLQRISSNFL